MFYNLKLNIACYLKLKKIIQSFELKTLIQSFDLNVRKREI